MRCLLLLSLGVVLLSAPAVRADEPAKVSWQAGVATVVITPKDLMWMSGYGARTKPAEGKVHDLYAKALALQAPDGKRCVLIRSWAQKEGGYEGGGAMVYYGLPAAWSPRVEDLIVAAVHDQVRRARAGP